MTETKFEPWNMYPHIWKTESNFYTYLRGALRKALWMRSPIKIIYKNKNCSVPPKGIETRAKTGAYCSLTNVWTGKSKLQVDHKVGEQSLRCVEDILPFIMHLVPPEGSLQLVEIEAHKIKSYAERTGLSFEEAVVAKKVIALCKKSVDKCTKELLSFGYTQKDISNAKKRKVAYTDLVNKGRL